MEYAYASICRRTGFHGGQYKGNRRGGHGLFDLEGIARLIVPLGTEKRRKIRRHFLTLSRDYLQRSLAENISGVGDQCVASRVIDGKVVGGSEARFIVAREY